VPRDRQQPVDSDAGEQSDLASLSMRHSGGGWHWRPVTSGITILVAVPRPEGGVTIETRGTWAVCLRAVSPPCPFPHRRSRSRSGNGT